MDEFQARFEWAVAEHQAGRLDRAAALYRQLLSVQPNHLDIQYLLGTLWLQKGDHRAAIEILESVRKQKEGVPEVHNNLGIAYNAVGKTQQAEVSFLRAIELRSNFDQAIFNLASLFESTRDFVQAEYYYRLSIEIDPNDPQATFNLGQVLKELRRYADAEDCYHRVLQVRSDDEATLIALGYVQVQQNKLDEAIQSFQQVIELDPEFAEVYSNLSFVYERQGRMEEAVLHALRAVAIKPNYAEGYNNLGTAYRGQHRLVDAASAFAKALEKNPNFALAEFNLATTWLLSGELGKGWPGYRRRLEIVSPPPLIPKLPEWDGISRGKVLLWSEQGYGDAIMAARLIPMVRERSGHSPDLRCQPSLRELFSRIPGVGRILHAYEVEASEGRKPPVSSSDDTLEGLRPPLAAAVIMPLPKQPAAADYDYQLPLMSLWPAFGLELDTIPADVPYLLSPDSARAQWASRLSGNRGMLVGICWQGNPKQERDYVRSCPAECFSVLREVPGVQLVSLQFGVGEIHTPAGILPLGADLLDFADTAGLIENLDLVITVDTAVAHLAGALGKPVWTLLANSADWRWFQEREDSPWYPTMRLFRQQGWGNWNSVFRMVTQALSELVCNRKESSAA